MSAEKFISRDSAVSETKNNSFHVILQPQECGKIHFACFYKLKK